MPTPLEGCTKREFPYRTGVLVPTPPLQDRTTKVGDVREYFT